jgi:hypothetical protein
MCFVHVKLKKNALVASLSKNYLRSDFIVLNCQVSNDFFPVEPQIPWYNQVPGDTGISVVGSDLQLFYCPATLGTNQNPTLHTYFTTATHTGYTLYL